MKRMFALLLTGVMALSMAACGLNGDGADLAEEVSTELNLYMPEKYISEKLIADFEAENNCTVNLFAMNDLSQGMDALLAGSDVYDLILTQNMQMENLIDGEYIQKLNLENIPNTSNLEDSNWTSKRYGIPYLMQYLYVIYDAETCPVKITSYNDLLDPAMKGQISSVDGERNLFCMALEALGYAPNSTEHTEITEAYDWLVKFNENVAVYDSDEQSLLNGDVSAAITYDRNAARAMAQKDSIQIAPLAKDKIQLITDMFVIPAEAKHVDLAEKFLNYLCDPIVMEGNLEEFPYACPNAAAVLIASDAYKSEPSRAFDYKDRIFFQKNVEDAEKWYENYYQQLKEGTTMHLSEK